MLWVENMPVIMTIISHSREGELLEYKILIISSPNSKPSNIYKHSSNKKTLFCDAIFKLSSKEHNIWSLGKYMLKTMKEKDTVKENLYGRIC